MSSHHGLVVRIRSSAARSALAMGARGRMGRCDYGSSSRSGRNSASKVSSGSLRPLDTSQL